jgi:hypothetical protein
LEETRNNTAWDNQLKGCMIMMTRRIIGNRKRKATGKQLITYFGSTLEAPFIPAPDTDAHLDRSAIIFTIKKLQTCKPKQDSNTRPRQRQQKERDQRTKYETNKQMDKEDGIMKDHSKHLCQQQRMEQECIKNRIKQTVTAFLTTIIVTLIILNTGKRNTAVHKQGIRTPQQEQCTHKQGNRDERREEHRKRASTTNTSSQRPGTNWTAPSTATEN